MPKPDWITKCKAILKDLRTHKHGCVLPRPPGQLRRSSVRFTLERESPWRTKRETSLLGIHRERVTSRSASVYLGSPAVYVRHSSCLLYLLSCLNSHDCALRETRIIVRRAFIWETRTIDRRVFTRETGIIVRRVFSGSMEVNRQRCIDEGMHAGLSAGVSVSPQIEPGRWVLMLPDALSLRSNVMSSADATEARVDALLSTAVGTSWSLRKRVFY